LEPSLCVVSSWIIRVYTILVWNIISGSFNLDNCFYHCLILISISHLKTLFIIIIIIIIIITIIVVVVVLLLFIIYIVNFPVIRPWYCRVIYYFDTPALGRRHQSFGRVSNLTRDIIKEKTIFISTWISLCSDKRTKCTNIKQSQGKNYAFTVDSHSESLISFIL
jgi:hypothetical protein